MSTSATPVDVVQVANAGLTCCRCGYDLRGQPSCGKCPECGERVEVSVAHAANPPTRPQGSLALALGLGSLFPFLILLVDPLKALGLFLFSPFLGIPGLCVAIGSLRHWHNGATAQRVMLVFGLLLSLTGLGLFAGSIYLLSNFPIC